MGQTFLGLILFIFLLAPPVANFLESMMILHMHMQMPLIVIAGVLMTPYFQRKFPHFFAKWNANGVPGIVLFILIMSYWMIPRTMDDALESAFVQGFKFVSLAFMAGVPLRDSWKKLQEGIKSAVFIVFFALFTVTGLLYIFADEQLCNNYLEVEQLTLGWSFLALSACIVVYLIYDWLIDPADYE